MKQLRKHRPHIANAAALWNVLARCRPTPEEDTLRVMNIVRTAWQLLRDGTGAIEQMNTVGVAFNVGIVRAEAIHPDLLTIFMTAGEALQAGERRLAKCGRYGFAALELAAVDAAMEAYGEIVAASSPLQLHQAYEEAMRRLTASASQPAPPTDHNPRSIP